MSLIYVANGIYAPEHSFKMLGLNTTINTSDEGIIMKFPTLLPVSARVLGRQEVHQKKLFLHKGDI